MLKGKRYTFNIKDQLLPKNPENGREQSTISYEFDFQVPENATLSNSSTIFIPWKALKATYRGKEKSDAARLNTTSIKRFGIMMRRSEVNGRSYPVSFADQIISFFGEQEGAFALQLESISAVKMNSGGRPSGPSYESVPLLASTKEHELDVKPMHSPAQSRSFDEVCCNILNHTMTQ
jgi:hypothetical protein